MNPRYEALGSKNVRDFKTSSQDEASRSGEGLKTHISSLKLKPENEAWRSPHDTWQECGV